MNIDNFAANLIPVSEWVYDLFEVSFWDRESEKDRVLIKKMGIVASCENHLESDIDRFCPTSAQYYTWERVKENVGHPRIVGSMYGRAVYENGVSHAQRLQGLL